MRKSSSAAGTLMPGYSLAHSGSSCSRGPGSSTAPDSEWAPTAEAFSSTQTLAAALSCFRRMAHARPAGPAPTTRTSYCMTSRSIAPVALLASATSCLFRLHADRPIQPDGLAVQHRNLKHARDQLGELFRPAEPRGKRDLSCERVLHFLRHAVHHRRTEDTRGDRHATDAEARQLARNRQRHAGDRRLGRSVRGLADLTFEGG